MTDDHTDGAIVHGIGSIYVKRRRHKDPCGKDNFVKEGIVVGVRGWRRHAPSTAVDRFANCETVVVHIETASGHGILPEIVAAYGNVTVIFPFVRVADFHIEGGELG